jgi:putative NIF3 family GTP cyclohydrolase 1 type 2
VKIKGTLDGSTQKPGLVFYGELPQAMLATDFAQAIQQNLQREPLHIAGSKPKIKTLAWCTGGAQDYLQLAVDNEIDAFVTGEVSERTYHLAKEADIHFFGAGHHATERYGIKALGDLLADKFALKHVFLDEDNPV